MGEMKHDWLLTVQWYSSDVKRLAVAFVCRLLSSSRAERNKGDWFSVVSFGVVWFGSVWYFPGLAVVKSRCCIRRSYSCGRSVRRTSLVVCPLLRWSGPRETNRNLGYARKTICFCCVVGKFSFDAQK